LDAACPILQCLHSLPDSHPAPATRHRFAQDSGSYGSHQSGDRLIALRLLKAASSRWFVWAHVIGGDASGRPVSGSDSEAVLRPHPLPDRLSTRLRAVATARWDDRLATSFLVGGGGRI